MKSLFYDIKSQPWNADDFFIPKNVKDIYTMLTDEEGLLLRWVAECYFSGAGAICELGTFLGGSSARLAYGLSKNANKTNKKSSVLTVTSVPSIINSNCCISMALNRLTA